MDLFTQARQEERKRQAPLADRMRPETLDEFVGQEAIVGPGKLLRRAIQADKIGSLIFWGPPGTGKTTLARIIARTTRSHFVQLNAVTSGVAELRQTIEDARKRLNMYGERTILFIDEIHRFNKAQQDALLPAVEDGTVILIGATTENPSFEVNSALVSRSRLFRLEALTDQDLAKIIDRALTDKERGLGKLPLRLDPAAKQHLINVANGDARMVLNALELAALTTPPDDNGEYHLTLDVIADSVQRRIVTYDGTGDQHYDTISAFIKSLRGSDPDAALYWLAKMLYAGEDPLFIARRMVIFAAEDIGNADPMALVVANNVAQAVQFVGMPEGRIPLAQGVTYLASAPKSNASYLGINKALADVEHKRTAPVPMHLRNPVTKEMAQAGYGQGYLYPHDFPGHWVPQDYLPKEMAGTIYYEPTENGFEQQIKERLDALRAKKQKKE